MKGDEEPLYKEEASVEMKKLIQLSGASKKRLTTPRTFLTLLTGYWLLLSWTSANSAPLTPQEKSQGFRLLFNGKDTTGWRAYQGPDWKVEKGELIGPSYSSGWIGTIEEFDNFILRLEYWVDRGTTHESNSGIFIRSATEGPSWARAYEIQISLQDRNNPTGSIYNRVPTNLEQMQRIAPEKHWNKVEIRACGSRIQVWINGIQVQDADLHLRERGVIGLQQHHPGVTIKYRNIRIKPLKPQDCVEDWETLPLDSTLKDWKASGSGRWSVVEFRPPRLGLLALLRGSQWESPGPVLQVSEGPVLFRTQNSFKDVELRAMVRLRQGGQGVLVIRDPGQGNQPPPPEEALLIALNHQSNAPFTGTLIGRREPKVRITRDGAWFSLRVRVKGDQAKVWVNGQAVAEAKHIPQTRGPIALYFLGNQGSLEIRDLYYRYPEGGNKP